MTKEDFDKLEWQFVSHLALEDEHCTTHRCINAPEGHTFSICSHVTTGVRRRCYHHYMIDGKVCKSENKLMEAIKDI